MSEDSLRFSPEHLRDMINHAKDASLKYKYAAATGEGMGDIEGVLDELSEYDAVDLPANGPSEYKQVCEKVAEAMKGKWDAFHSHHIERLSGAYDAVGGRAVEQNSSDDHPRISLQELIVEYQNERIKVGVWKQATVTGP